MLFSIYILHRDLRYMLLIRGGESKFLKVFFMSERLKVNIKFGS